MKVDLSDAMKIAFVQCSDDFTLFEIRQANRHPIGLEVLTDTGRVDATVPARSIRPTSVKCKSTTVQGFVRSSAAERVLSYATSRRPCGTKLSTNVHQHFCALDLLSNEITEMVGRY